MDLNSGNGGVKKKAMKQGLTDKKIVLMFSTITTKCPTMCAKYRTILFFLIIHPLSFNLVRTIRRHPHDARGSYDDEHGIRS